MSSHTMEQVIAELGFAVDDYFGGCPECGKLEGWCNIGRDHWALCHTHKNRWCVGSNLFSSWREQNETDWRKNERELRDYVAIDPLPPTDPGNYANDAFYYQQAMSGMLAKLRERRRLVSAILTGNAVPLSKGGAR